jgi:DNA-binding MarR family transcriptional regulator
MDVDMIERVRGFNREVTQRVGALDDRYLARGRPLGEARLLWEIGEAGRDIRALRSRLDLDSGYLSRLLRSLEAAGLVTVGPGEGDGRVRTAHLTAAGRAERAALDRGSDELAASLLEPLNAHQRERLVTAMGEVQRLLTAALVRIAPADPTSEHARHSLREYAAELDRRFAGGYDPAQGAPLDAAAMRPPRGLLLVATLRSEPVGCGALRFHADATTELKRLWVAPAARGLGVGRRLMLELEAHAGRHGDVVRLDSNGALTEAIALYRSSGYVEVAAFNDDPYPDHWFEKRLR